MNELPMFCPRHTCDADLNEAACAAAFGAQYYLDNRETPNQPPRSNVGRPGSTNSIVAPLSNCPANAASFKSSLSKLPRPRHLIIPVN